MAMTQKLFGRFEHFLTAGMRTVIWEFEQDKLADYMIVVSRHLLPSSLRINVSIRFSSTIGHNIFL